MSETKLKVRFQHAVKTEAEWASANPVLKTGEIAYSKDKKQWKTGDGTSKWSDLTYDKAEPVAHSHSYLPLSGGTMTGTANIQWADSGNWNKNNDGVTFPVKRGGLIWNGQSDSVQLYAEETANDNLDLVLKFTDDDSNGLSIRNSKNTQVARINSTGEFTGSLNWNNIKNKPSTYAPSDHNHDSRYYTETEIDDKLKGKSDTTHTHDLSKMINTLSVGSSTPTDADYYVSQYAGGGTTTTSYHRRPMSALWAYIQTKLHKVATSGSYNDLSNKPTIGNGTVTIKQAGTSKGTFTMNQTGDTTIELTDNNTNTWRGIQDNLTSTSTTDSLSANQGKILNDRSYQMRSLQIGSTTDFNTINSSGCYKVQMSAWGDKDTYHGPNQAESNLYSYGLLTVDRALNDTENRILQVYYPHNSSNASSGVIMTRMYNGSSWNAWMPITKGTTWGNILNKPSTFAPSAHTHDDRYYTETEMNSKLDAKLDKSGGDVTGFITAVNSAAANIGFTAKNSETGKSVSLMVDSGKYNRGVYDHVGDKWMIYADQANNVIVNGTASKANSVAWANVTDKILVSSNGDGLMRKEDKTKLDAFNAASTYASTDYVKTQISNAGYLKKVIVSTLPSSSNAQENIIYMVQKTSADKNNSYDEYMFVNGNLEKIGDNQVVLETLTNADIDEILGGKYSSSTSGLDNVVLG